VIFVNGSLKRFFAAWVKFKRELAFAISPEVKAECEYRNIKKAFESGFKAAKRSAADYDCAVSFDLYMAKSAGEINKRIDTRVVRY
jgi:hypothetical protein